MRASKLPFRNFEYNIRRAEALARLDSYLEDLLYNEGKGTIQPLFKITNELMQAMGIEEILSRVLGKVEKSLKNEFEAEYKQKGKEQYEKIAKDYIKRQKPYLQKIQKMFEDLGLLMDQTLLDQALVAAVSAFEVYLKELIASVVMLNLKIRQRFYPEINKVIDVTRLEEYGQDAKRVQGEIVADLIRLDMNNIKSMLNRLLDLENVFGDHKTELKVCKIFEIRHIIIHRAGLTDPKFKKITKFRGSIDTQIKISRKYVLSSIRTLRDLAQRIETYIDSIR